MQVASDITLRNVLLDNIKHKFVKIMRNVMLYIHLFIYFVIIIIGTNDYNLNIHHLNGSNKINYICYIANKIFHKIYNNVYHFSGCSLYSKAKTDNKFAKQTF